MQNFEKDILTITLFSGVSLPIPNSNLDVADLGFWGADPNLEGYNPDVKVGDLKPKDSDFIKVPFRLLTADVVGAGTYQATDFSNIEVLKGSMSKLEGITVYTEHSQETTGWVGIVKNVKWSDERVQIVNGERVVIPAGINGDICIDAKVAPKLARGMLSGAITSNSVTVSFKWEQSHVTESSSDFYDNIGRLSDDGTMIRRVVTDIVDYFETSLVFLGADPYAKAITAGGDLRRPDLSHAYKPIKTKQQSNSYDYSIPLSLSKNILSLSRNNNNKKDTAMKTSVQNPPNLDQSDQNPKVEPIAIASLNGDAGDSNAGKVTTAKNKVPANEPIKKDAGDLQTQLDAVKAELKTSNDDLQTHKQAVIDLKAENEAVKLENSTLKQLESEAQIGRDYYNLKLEEVKRLYNLTVDVPDKAVISLFEKADFKALDGLLSQYSNKVLSKFTGRCNDCHSVNIAFKSSVDESEPVQIEQDTAYRPPTGAFDISVK